MCITCRKGQPPITNLLENTLVVGHINVSGFPNQGEKCTSCFVILYFHREYFPGNYTEFQKMASVLLK